LVAIPLGIAERKRISWGRNIAEDFVFIGQLLGDDEGAIVVVGTQPDSEFAAGQ
jgi:hypothetical protein